MITTEIKKQIIAAIADKRQYFTGSDSKFAASLGIGAPQYSRIKNGELDKVLSDANWISLARKFDVQIGNNIQWNNAITPFFTFVQTQLAFCKKFATSRILCDIADIGKTHSALYFTASNANTVYVDCSQYKSKQKLVRFLAKGFGLSNTGVYSDVYEDLVFYIRQLETPLIILDEVGDLEYSAFLECKALWNATEGVCAWYMMGADGLKNKIDTRIQHRKVGYTEIFSRYGNKYQKVAPEAAEEIKDWKAEHAALIIQANFPAGVNVPKIIAAAGFTLRNLRDERKKLSA